MCASSGIHRSSRVFPALLLGIWGLHVALFFPPNHAAMISSVPNQHRGVATGAVYVMFGLGSTLGVSLGTLVLTTAFRYYTASDTATPTSGDPAAFVSALNVTFFVSVVISAIALLCSAMRGTSAAHAR